MCFQSENTFNITLSMDYFYIRTHVRKFNKQTNNNAVQCKYDLINIK